MLSIQSSIFWQPAAAMTKVYLPYTQLHDLFTQTQPYNNYYKNVRNFKYCISQQSCYFITRRVNENFSLVSQQGIEPADHEMVISNFQKIQECFTEWSYRRNEPNGTICKSCAEYLRQKEYFAPTIHKLKEIRRILAQRFEQRDAVFLISLLWKKMKAMDPWLSDNCEDYQRCKQETIRIYGRNFPRKQQEAELALTKKQPLVKIEVKSEIQKQEVQKVSVEIPKKEESSMVSEQEQRNQ